MLFVKFILLLLLGFVIVSLFTGLYFLVKDKGQTNRTVNALSVRIGLSLLAIVIVIIAGATGVIEINPRPLSIRPAPPIVDPNAAGNDQIPGELEPEQRSSGRRRIEE
ncbi:twin transmembrane helix small protein [Granulosicoccus antarcticus]|uniref:HIG1 domain-containing protein n=1 Tax=Granulosicoccus antarcticus IMCC3135 TaxID=1192854 RepID=A0A2Z2NJ84_9GAMM|nr:twin transmembrane helix small protein [Granulosicoccus antarcticus]ASJ71153.1 hypothetical protein IMCC3135_05200 [Granulosicoccus antarcticus IMCC3135]